MEAVLTFINFCKAFDSVDHTKMFQILEAYGILPDVFAAIRVMYKNTSAVVLIPEGKTDQFTTDTRRSTRSFLVYHLFGLCPRLCHY